MGEEQRRCRHCLLADMADENDYYESVKKYRATMPQNKRTSDELYEARLSACRLCEQLDSGTCMQCGCYVEMRAARVDMKCPLKSWPDKADGRKHPK